jgi:uncharacterized membrane protein
MSGLFHSRGCALWGVVALVALLLLAGLLIYIDRRFGPEASAFFLGISLGIPLLLVIVVIVGGIYVLVIRGAMHLQERDDAGEIGRLRTLGELARSDRSYAQRDREALRLARRVAEGQPASLPAALPLAEDWDDGEWDDAANARGGQTYRIVE